MSHWSPAGQQPSPHSTGASSGQRVQRLFALHFHPVRQQPPSLQFIGASVGHTRQ
jgi:hypothetical protein